ncbi:NAD-dependent epimerase/dehydratase family protein [Cysteiniphilum sp. 6C5]|uniref:NAD-dependent epimerase/dehydratase family protein n=1 Tax=unclassified Cysteiniphilum TaxID=2610889 RepID=UPI003F860FF9
MNPVVKNIIIGKSSNLSEQLARKLDSCSLHSARDAMENGFNVAINGKSNIIFNNFQPATLLTQFDDPDSYINNAIGATAKILNALKENRKHINRVLYTSSSSIYGSIVPCLEDGKVEPKSLHAALKLSNELLIKGVCQAYNIDFTLIRLFNMYGGNDNFSVVSKIIKAVKDSREFDMVNKGQGYRDFIHVEDVVEVYLKLLTVNDAPELVNVGTGVGVKVCDLIEVAKECKPSFDVREVCKSVEIIDSVADIGRLKNIMEDYKFRSVIDFVREKCK